MKNLPNGLDNLPPKNDQLRQQLNFILESEGIDALINIAKSMDIDGEKVNLSNPQRIIRAIEIKQGKPDDAKEIPPNDFYDTSYYYLNRDRQELYNRINKQQLFHIQSSYFFNVQVWYIYLNSFDLSKIKYILFIQN